MTEIAIRTENLSRHYGEVQALKPLNLDVPAGSIFGFLGRNGAGKTTTMRLLAGLARPSTGRAWIDGIETTQADSAARATFGYLPQDPAFYPWMSARDYLDYVGKLFQMDKATRQRRSDEVLTLAGLTDAAKRPIRGFSGGMVQRLGVAQALLHNPPVLLLDEPTSAMDPQSAKQVRDAIIELQRDERTFMITTHNLTEAQALADRIAIIRRGRIIANGTLDDLARKFVGDPLMELRARGPLNGLARDLGGLVLVETSADNWLRYRAPQPEVVNPLVLRRALALGAEVVTLAPVSQTLEDIYLQVVKEDEAQEAAHHGSPN